MAYIKKGRAKTLSPEHKASISRGMMGKNTWTKGGKRSEETKKKISRNSARFWLDKTISEETRKKISDTIRAHPTRYWLGKKRSVEDREKMSKSHLGKIPW